MGEGLGGLDSQPSGRGGPAPRGAHARSRPARRHGRRGPLLATGCLAAACIVVAGGLLVLTRSGSSSASPGGAGPGQGPSTVSKVSAGPLHVASTNPAPKSTNVPSDTTLTVRFSAPLATGTPMPTLSPPIAGSWAFASPTTLRFVGSGPLVPGSTETIAVPGGRHGVEAAGGKRLPSAVTVGFSVATGSELRLQQLLAELGYLPVSFSASSPVAAPQDEADPQPGTFAWRWANQPAELTSLWTPGTSNVITKGAIMEFEDQHNLGVDGVAGPQVWATLLAAAAANQMDSQPYPYVYVGTNNPETVTVYQNGAPVYNTLANTGVAGAPTAAGTFTVFARYTTTTMSGTNPDGSTYVDPGIPWVSYFNGGDALHGYVRSSYGFPQSDGCVEMPISNAAVVYPMTPLGTLVTVQQSANTA
jgi:lipoprotein-anchoring transpeptidase ErfK/SrfK